MNSVKISGLVLMGAFSVGVASGSAVSAVAGTEGISDIVNGHQEDELTELNNNGKDSTNVGDNSDAETDAGESSDENKENIEGNLANEDNESSEKNESGNVGAAKVAGYVAGGIGTAGALGTGVKLAYDKFAKDKQNSEEKGQNHKTEQDDNNDTKPAPNGTDPKEKEENSGSLRVADIVGMSLGAIAAILAIILLAIFMHEKCKSDNSGFSTEMGDSLPLE